LAQNSSLTTLNLAGNYIGDDGAKALSAALAQNSSLTTLNLTDNEIGADGAQALGAALAQNSSLTTLNLSYNKIGDDALVAAVAQSSSLTTLNLSCNEIGDNGAQALGAALAQNSSLTTLNLDYNEIGDEGAKALADSFEPISHSDLPASQPAEAASSSADHHVSSFFSVLVKVFNGDLLSIECSSHESVRTVKRKICEVNSAYSAHRLQLVVERSQAVATAESESKSDLASSASSSVILSDALALSDYQVSADDTLHLLLLPCKVCQKYLIASLFCVWNIQGHYNLFGLRFYLHIRTRLLKS
jgi:Ran GTPase-activating protein (RanGAP) involved in mRNA processing and transport